MNITKQSESTTTTLILEGWLDTQAAPELGKAIDEIPEDTKLLILDFAQLEYISSSGLREVVYAYKKMSDGEFKVVNVSTEIMEIFKMTGFDKKININPA